MNHMTYAPLALPFFTLLILAFLALVFLIQLSALRYAYMSIGLSSGMALLVLLGSLIGSMVNIPVFNLPPERMVTDQQVDYFGMTYVVPVLVNTPGTIIAVNVGGAVIPTVISLYLLARNGLWLRGVLAIACVAAACHHLAEPVRGVGIALPIFAPPLITVAIVLILAWRYAAPLAYVSGSLGTLIGADLLNLGKVGGLGAPVASIGGAGTFDGIFLTGILAVLLASFTVGRAPSARRHA